MITEEITSMTEGQRKQLMRVIEDAVDSLKITKEGADEILKVGNLVQKDLKGSLGKHSIADKRFGPAIREFEITVPADYNHEKQLDDFAKRTKKLKTTYYFNEALTSKNFSKATNKLAPSKKMKVKIFPILERVTSEDCMTFLRKQNAVLVGGQGITLVYDLKKEEFPKDKYTVSFDEKDALWEDAGGHHRVPGVSAFEDGDFKFSLGYFEGDWSDDVCLLCLCDM